MLLALSHGEALSVLLGRYGLQLSRVPVQETIPGSYWGEPEAGLIGKRIYLRADTPLHSVLHESSHFICMDERRRERLHTDAASDDREEAAVCYLQVLLADRLAIKRERLFADMDAWGYSFRCGSSRVWFERDASDERDWLLRRGLIDRAGRPTWRRRIRYASAAPTAR